MQVVPATRTPLTEGEAVAALLVAMPELDRNQAALLLALVWIETGSGGATQHNPGNLTASATYSGKAWRPPWFEITPASSERMKRLHALMLEHKAPSAFRAYDSFTEGYSDWARRLRADFPALLRAASSGHAPTFRAELARKYSADYGPKHDQTLAHLQAKFLPYVATLPGPAPSPVITQPATDGAPAGGLLVLLALSKLLGAMA